jgi:hypothetical protein
MLLNDRPLESDDGQSSGNNHSGSQSGNGQGLRMATAMDREPQAETAKVMVQGENPATAIITLAAMMAARIQATARVEIAKAAATMVTTMATIITRATARINRLKFRGSPSVAAMQTRAVHPGIAVA